MTKRKPERRLGDGHSWNLNILLENYQRRPLKHLWSSQMIKVNTKRKFWPITLPLGLEKSPLGANLSKELKVLKVLLFWGEESMVLLFTPRGLFSRPKLKHCMNFPPILGFLWWKYDFTSHLSQMVEYFTRIQNLALTKKSKKIQKWLFSKPLQNCDRFISVKKRVSPLRKP